VSSQVTNDSGAQDVITYAYDDIGGLGNLTVKSDYASSQRYSENGAGPNAITTSVLLGDDPNDADDDRELQYLYDANGNRKKDKLENLLTGEFDPVATYKYDANNLLVKSELLIKNPNNLGLADSSQIHFLYGVDQQRYLRYEKSSENQDDNNDGSSDYLVKEATVYAGPYFEETTNLETISTELKLQVSDYLSVSLKPNGNIDKHFLFKDRLGSTTMITNDSGALVKTMSYDVFGKPRNGDNWSPLNFAEVDFKDGPNASMDITRRGFTDHEHIDAFELIHMNGRMYDFNNGRFLSVDPFIQGVTSQAINPYSYIQNNPLSGVDPTGYAIWFAPAVPYVVKTLGWGAVAYGAAEAGEKLGVAKAQYDLGEKTFGALAAEVAPDLAFDVTVTILGGAAAKLGEKIIPESIRNRVSEKVSSIFDNGNQNGSVDAVQSSDISNLEARNTDQDMIENLIDARSRDFPEGGSGNYTYAQGRDADGNLTKVYRDIKDPTGDRSKNIHAEVQVLEELRGNSKGSTIAVDQDPCPGCSPKIVDGEVDNVILPQHQSRDISPKGAAKRAAHKNEKDQVKVRKVEVVRCDKAGSRCSD
jgi:RHS repeat-associated protein